MDVLRGNIEKGVVEEEETIKLKLLCVALVEVAKNILVVVIQFIRIKFKLIEVFLCIGILKD